MREVRKPLSACLHNRNLLLIRENGKTKVHEPPPFCFQAPPSLGLCR